MAGQGNPINCPFCNERIPRIAETFQKHLKDIHSVSATRAELHRLASPKYRQSKDKPQEGGDLMDHVVMGGFETNRKKH